MREKSDSGNPYNFPTQRTVRYKEGRRRLPSAFVGPMALPPPPTAPGLTILRPGQAKFESYMSCYNKRTISRPLIRAACSTTDAVVAMVNWVRQHSLPFAVRSGGHSFEGFSNSTNVVIDLRDLKKIVPNPTAHEVTVEAGATLGDIYLALAPQGFAFVGGTCPFVGIGGHVLGGGYGFLARAFGLACDNLRSLQLVNANGQLLTVNSSSNPDLFWACRGGGGGSFGVATQFTFSVPRLSQVRTFKVVWSLQRAQALQVIRAWRQWAPNAPTTITSLLNIGMLPSGNFQVKCLGQTIGSDPEIQDALRNLAAVAQPVSQTVKLRSFSEAVRYFAGIWEPETNFTKESSDMTAALSDQAILALLDQFAGIPAGHVIALIDAYGGAINKMANNASAFPHRSGTAFCIHYYSQWSSSRDTVTRTDRTKAVFNAMRPHFLGDAYVNYCDLALANFEQSYWGANLPRLKAIKRQVDPGNLFRHPQSVRPI